MSKQPAPYSPQNKQERIDARPAFLIGKHPTKDEFLASYGEQFLMLAAPPGTGKGVSMVVPNALSYPDSMVINDPKFENWDITSGFRAAAGHKVYRFSPERLETHRWNPLDAISTDPLYRLGDIRTIARVRYVSDKRLGNTTVRVQNQSLNRQKHEMTARGQTESYSEQARALMLPQEVNELPYEKELIFVQSTAKKPAVKILARKIVYFQEDVFKARMRMTPACTQRRCYKD